MSLTFFCLPPLSPPLTQRVRKEGELGGFFFQTTPTFCLIQIALLGRRKRRRKGWVTTNPLLPIWRMKKSFFFLFRVPNFEFKDRIFIVKGKGLVVVFWLFRFVCPRFFYSDISDSSFWIIITKPGHKSIPLFFLRRNRKNSLGGWWFFTGQVGEH